VHLFRGSLAAEHTPNPVSSDGLSSTSPNAVTSSIIGAYLVATIAIGYFLRRKSITSSQFLHARRALPTAVTAVAFLAANCGALEIVGIVAASAKYGAIALHFYWLGAIPAMLFLALFMMPVYARSGAMTVPDFLRVRYGPATQILSAVSLAVMMVFVSGIGLYAISSVLNLFFHWSFFNIAIVSSTVVLCYTLAGGLKATIYNEILQFALTIAGLIPLAWLVLRDFHGIHPLMQQLPEGMAHIWTSLPAAQPRTAPMDIFGLVFGLGFVLSCGYWCTDFLLIQRALAAKDLEASVNTPLFAAIAKLFFPILIVLPGLAAAVFFHKDGTIQYDQALPFLMRHYYGYALLGLGISAILASLMSGLAGNIGALSALWTHDLYRAHIKPGKSDAHYVLVGRVSATVACFLSVFAAYISFRYNNLMDYLQLLFSLFNAPLFAVFLLGMFTTWATASAGFWGLLCGVAVAGAHNLAVRYGLIPYGSQMLANFYGAIYGWTACIVVACVLSQVTPRKSPEELKGITYFTQDRGLRHISAKSWALAGSVLLTCIVLNFIFR
jgi:solute:Na+ symporter, SSS family